MEHTTIGVSKRTLETLRSLKSILNRAIRNPVASKKLTEKKF